MTSSLSESQTKANLKDFTVAIVGGGLCGLACAIGLRKAGVNVHIYEAAVRILILIRSSSFSSHLWADFDI